MPTASPWVSAVVGGDLQGVGQRVAVVEQRPPAALALVGATTSALISTQRATRSVSVIASRSSPVRKWYLAISPSPERRSRARQRGQRVEVADHAGRLPERADEVLALGQVDAGLAADRRVDHAEQRRGDVHDRHAAVPRGGGEAGDVGDHAAADGDDDVVAGQARSGRSPRVSASTVASVLCGLAVADLEPLDRRRPGSTASGIAGLGHDARPAAPSAAAGRRSAATAPWPTTTS